MKNTKLVWSNDPRENRKCAVCGEFTSACECVPEESVNLSQVTAVFRMESKGRGGKTVTVVDRLPKNEAFLKELCREIKTQCGTGGTHSQKDGSIEIQGDKRPQIKALFDKKGIKYKGM